MPPHQNSPHPAEDKPGSYRVISKLAYLLSARWFRDILQAIFLIYLARLSATTYGEFMLALGLGGILLLIGQFGLDLPLVSLLTPKDSDTGEALSLVTLLKGGLLGLACLGAVGFVYWQDYGYPLKQVMLLISAGMGIEALANTFFVALQVKGRQKLEGKIKVLAAALAYGYGLIGLILGAPPFLLAFFKLIENAVNLLGGIVVTYFQDQVAWQWPSLPRLVATARQAFVFALLQVVGVTYNKANLFFLQRYDGAQGLAQYSATWQVVDVFSGLISSLLLKSVLFPLFVHFWEVDRQEVFRLAQNTARWLMASALILMFFLYIESDRLISLVYGPQYQDAIWMQKYLVITIFFAFLHNLAAFLMMSMRLERLLLAFYLMGLAFNLLWCSLAIPGAPLMGTVLAMVLTKGIVAALTVSYAQRRLGMISLRVVVQLTVAVLTGLALYLLSLGHTFREVAEGLALLPILALVWYWWRGGD